MLDALLTNMAKATPRDVQTDPYLRPAIERLAGEAQFLYDSGRHDWVKKRAGALNDTGNWAAYAMEVHVSHTFEQQGVAVKTGVCLLNGDKTDVDIVWSTPEGVSVRMECVSLHELEKFWQSDVSVGSGIEIKSALHDAGGEAEMLTAVQKKIRQKTVRNSDAIKFPDPDPSALHIIVADVSEAPGWRPDLWDLQLMSLGRNAVNAAAQRAVLGLFESSNSLGPQYDDEFVANRYLRTRVHGIIYLVDRSTWHGPLDPSYQGCCVSNPNIGLDCGQAEALNLLGKHLSGLVEAWMVNQRWV